MKIGVLGTGMVGQTIATKLVSLGHEVRMGSRTAGGESATAWAAAAGEGAAEGTFAEAAKFGELLFNCTAGMGSLEALRAAGEESLAGKVLIDVSNPLDFSAGMPPTLSVCNTDSPGEQIQREFPEARVVKALNTINCQVMVDPGRAPGDHVIFMGGNDPDAKRDVGGLLGELGWPPERVIELGDISSARGTEMYLPLWLRLYGSWVAGTSTSAPCAERAVRAGSGSRRRSYRLRARCRSTTRKLRRSSRRLTLASAAIRRRRAVILRARRFSRTRRVTTPCRSRKLLAPSRTGRRRPRTCRTAESSSVPAQAGLRHRTLR